jgi:hypothetical protein
LVIIKGLDNLGHLCRWALDTVYPLLSGGRGAWKTILTHLQRAAGSILT